MTTFKNPEKGNIEIITRKDFYWCLLFGFLYFIKKNMVSCSNKFRLGIFGIPVESLNRPKVPQCSCTVQINGYTKVILSCDVVELFHL